MKLTISCTSALMKRRREDAILRSSLKVSGPSTKMAANVCTYCDLMAFCNLPVPRSPVEPSDSSGVLLRLRRNLREFYLRRPNPTRLILNGICFSRFRPHWAPNLPLHSSKGDAWTAHRTLHLAGRCTQTYREVYSFVPFHCPKRSYAPDRKLGRYPYKRVCSPTTSNNVHTCRVRRTGHTG